MTLLSLRDDMRLLFGNLSIVGTLFFLLSCADVSVDTADRSAPAADTLVLRNIPWVLTLVTMGDSVLKLDDYEPFHFVVGDTLVFGDDGCNSYTGGLELRNDSVTVRWVSKTSLGCGGRRFNPCELLGTWRIGIQDTSVVLTNAGTTLEFCSRFVNSVTAYNFVDKEWRLRASNDTATGSLQAVDLLPELGITSNREFTLRWYFTPRNPIFESNYVGGLFGIGDGESIYFYRMYGAYSHPDGLSGLGDMYFVDRIIHSTHFSLSDTLLTMKRQSDGLFYEFVLVE